MKPSVYFVQDGDGNIKIGASRQAEKRLRFLQTAHGKKLVMLGVIDGGRQRELALHEKFESSKISGEWFRPTDEILSFINEHVRKPNQARHIHARAKAHYYNRDSDFARKIVAFLKARYPRKTVFRVAEDTGCRGEQIAKWLEGACAPGGPALLRLIEVYGPDLLLATLETKPQWLIAASNDQQKNRIEQKIAAKKAELSELVSQAEQLNSIAP